MTVRRYAIRMSLASALSLSVSVAVLAFVDARFGFPRLFAAGLAITLGWQFFVLGSRGIERRLKHKAGG